ncbi:NSP-interacting kinase-like protein [Melia azedarach]|nr:NSP-interacting kinase-like protein [Melia azedarach]
MCIKSLLIDPHEVLNDWDETSMDPCNRPLITCADGLVTGLGAPSRNLSGTLAPSIGNLTNLQLVLLQNNNISGHIPSEIGKLPKLDTLDLSNNKFVGSIPISVSNLRILKYLLETSSPNIKEQKIALAFGSSLGCICLLILGFGFLLRWSQRHAQQIFFDVNEQQHKEVFPRNLKRFRFKELQSASHTISATRT